MNKLHITWINLYRSRDGPHHGLLKSDLHKGIILNSNEWLTNELLQSKNWVVMIFLKEAESTYSILYIRDDGLCMWLSIVWPVQYQFLWAHHYCFLNVSHHMCHERLEIRILISIEPDCPKAVHIFIRLVTLLKLREFLFKRHYFRIWRMWRGQHFKKAIFLNF